ncbi:hypothetical protein ACFL3C_04295 [Patescibacteria group bacterium]
MTPERRERKDTLPMLTTGRSSARKWLEWIDQMEDVNMLLQIAKALNEREDAILPPADGRAVEMGYSREELISHALLKVAKTATDDPVRLLKRFIPYRAYGAKIHVISEIMNAPLDNKDDRTVTSLLKLGEFLALNQGYFPERVQADTYLEIFRKLQELEGIAAVSGEIRGSVERVS